MRGYLAVALSVVLVTLAQLCLKQGSVALPTHIQTVPSPSLLFTPAGHSLLTGIILYLLSIGCWLLALRSLQLSHASASLSLSYLLVPLFTPAPLPMTPTLLAGITLVTVGVLLVCLPQDKWP